MARLSWNFFVRRCRIDTADYIKTNECKTYAEFVTLLSGKGVTAPDESEVAEYFKPPKPRKTRPVTTSQRLGLDKKRKKASSKETSRPAAKTTKVIAEVATSEKGTKNVDKSDS